MAPTKSPTTPAAYLAALPADRRKEMKALHAAIRKTAPRLKPHLAYRYSILGYGNYHYRYASGREGDAPIVAISSRAHYISLYVMGRRKGQSLVKIAKPRLGKTNCGSCCIRFKKLSNLNLSEAMSLVREASALLDNGSTDFSL